MPDTIVLMEKDGIRGYPHSIWCSVMVEVYVRRKIGHLLGLDKETLGRIAAERAEMERAEKEQKTRLPGGFRSFRDDKEKKTLLFTGQYQKVDKPAVDW